MEITLATKAEKPKLRPLLHSYLKELGHYGPVDMAYPYFDAYWSEVNIRWPYIFKQDDQILGFAFVRLNDQGSVYLEMAEFYICPHVRNKNLGIQAATKIMQLHSGKWRLKVMIGNKIAHHFWPKVIKSIKASDIARNRNNSDICYIFSAYCS